MRGYEGKGEAKINLTPGFPVWVTGAALAEIENPSREELVFILLGLRMRHYDKWSIRGRSRSGARSCRKVHQKGPKLFLRGTQAW